MSTRKLVKLFRLVNNYLSARIALLVFSVRVVFFGFDNACNYLRLQDFPCLSLILKRYGAKIGKNCDIQNGITFHNCRNFRNLTIGDNCHVGKDCFFDLREKITIGNKVVISMRASLVTHIDMSKSDLSVLYPARCKPVSLGDNVYIGCGATILMGCKIGSSAIVAASALVKGTVPDNAVVAGVPARRVSNVSKI